MKKRVFLTGATGVMGSAGLGELVARRDKFDITVLVRDTKRNRAKMAKWGDAVRVVWGDLTNYDDVLRATTGADYEGIRACSSAIKPHHYDLLDERLAMFEKLVE